MEIFQSQFTISTKEKTELVNITDKVRGFVSESGVKNGTVTVFVPHATAAILINEDETGLKNDFKKFLQSFTENLGEELEHDRIDDNAKAHLASGIIGPSEVMLVKDGKLVLGTWQEIFLFELDGPRQNRKVELLVVGE